MCNGKNVMCIGKKEKKNKTYTFKDVCYENSKKEVILGITFDKKLTFDSHVKKL